MNHRLSALALAGLAATLASLPAHAATSVAIAVESLDLEAGAGFSASPLNLGVSIRQDLSELVYVGGQLSLALDDDKGAEVTRLFGADVGLQHAFSPDVGAYAFVGIGTAAVDVAGADGDGVSIRYGAGATIGIGRNGVLDIGWASLFDDDMDLGGGDVPVTIAGPHVGLGFRF